MSFKGYIREITTGEQITGIKARSGDLFPIEFHLFDDNGVPWSNDQTCTLNFFMSRLDVYSGTDDSRFAFSFSGTTEDSGSATVNITASGTSIPGDYICEVVLSSGTNIFTVGEFDYEVVSE